MAFIPYQYESGKTVSMKCANSATIVKGDAMVDDSNGLLTPSSSGNGEDIRYVAAESVVTTASGQEVLMWSTDGVNFLADCDAAWAQTDVLTEADLAAAGQVDPNASSDDLFFIERGVGVAGTGTQVIGHFTRGVMNVD